MTDHQSARARHEPDAHADLHLDDAGHAFLIDPRVPVITVALSADVRPILRHELLQYRRGR